MTLPAIAALTPAALAEVTWDELRPLYQELIDRPVDVAFACYGGLRLTNGRAGRRAQERGQGASDREAGRYAKIDGRIERRGPAAAADPGSGG